MTPVLGRGVAGVLVFAAVVAVSGLLDGMFGQHVTALVPASTYSRPRPSVIHHDLAAYEARGERVSCPSMRIRRQLDLVVADGTLRARYDLWLPTDHPLFRHFESGEVADELGFVARDVLGPVAVGEFPRLFGGRESWDLIFRRAQTVRLDPDNGRISLFSAPYPIDLADLTVDVNEARLATLCSGWDHVTVTMPHGSVQVRQRAAGGRYEDAPAERVERHPGRVVVRRCPVGGTEPAACTVQLTLRNLVEPSLRQSLMRYGWVTIPKIDVVWWTLLGIGPVLLVLLAVRRNRAGLGAAYPRVHRIAAVALAVPLAMVVLEVAIWVLDDQLDWHSLRLREDGWPGRSPGDLPGTGAVQAFSGLGNAVAVAVGCLLAAVLAAGDRPPATPRRLRGSPLWFGVLAVAAGGVTAAVVGRDGADRSYILTSAALAATLVGVLGLLFDLVLRWWGIRDRVVAVAAAAATATTAAYGRVLAITYLGETNWARVWLFGAVGMLLVLASGAFIRSAASTLLDLAGARAARGWSWVAAGAAVAFLGWWTLATIVLGPAEMDFGPWNLDAGLGQLWAVLGFVDLAILLVVGCRLDGTWSRASVAAMAAGFAGWAFYWDDRWFYLPVTLFLGVGGTMLALRNDLDHDAVARRGERLRTLIRSLGQEREALLTRRRALVTGFRTNDQPLGEYRKERDAFDGAIAAIDPRLQSRWRPTPDRLAEIAGGGWRHGLRAALAGAVLGLPWMVWVVLDTWKAPPPVRGDTIAMADVATTLVWNLVQWPMYGFFFGCFFPWLRGASGVSKALVLVLVVVLPPVVVGSVWKDDAAWIDYGISALQLVLFALLLGVTAGDLFLLRRLHLGWRQLLDLYQLRSVAAWGSALAIVVGALVTAALTTGLQGALSIVFDQLREQVQTPPVPRV